MTPSRPDRAPGDASALVVGSSPLMMCVALRLARGGWRVEVHDDRPVPGGAWCTTEAFGHSMVEPAVHLLENRPSSYAHLGSIPGIQLGPDPRVEGMRGARRLGPHRMRTIMFLGVWLRAIVRMDGPRMALAGRSLVRSVRNRSVPFQYPVGGSGGMIEALVRQLEVEGVRIVCRSRVTNCRMQSGVGGGVCETSSGPVSFDRLYFSSRAHPDFLLDGDPVDVLRHRSRLRCLVLQLHTPEEPGFGYMELLGDPLVRRLRNVGPFVRPTLAAERSIISIQVREEAARGLEPTDLVDAVLDRLRHRRLLGPDDLLIDWVDAPFAFSTIPDRELDRLNGLFGGAARGIATTDVAEGLVDLLDTPAESWTTATR